MKYHVITFGCEVNKADTERIERRLKMSGHKKTLDKNKADLIVLNACSVRQSAIDRLYGQINNLKNKRIILAGCVLESDKKKLKNKVSEIWHPDDYFDLLPIHASDFSAYVPIMTGCNNFCTYCAVPHTRGRERSRPAKDIIKEVKDLVNPPTGGGYKEIWLLGQNVNSYKSNKTNFPKLLKKINNIPGDFWIRFTSPHPKDFSNELIKTIAECEKVTKYINLPVQSGDNEILKRMNRNYTREKYIKLVNKIRKTLPDVAISTDTIVGFPGETKKQFLNSVSLYKKLKFDMAFIARYSPRPGTVSAMTMKDNVPHKEKERRWKMLTKTLEKTALEHNKKLVNKTLRVLIDSTKEVPRGVGHPLRCPTPKYFGRTEGNKVVEITEFPKVGPWEIIGSFIDIKITKAGSWKLKGAPAKPKIIVVLGPTASGKSDLAVEIAKKFNGEVVSADSRQVYKYMDIGTGKVTKKEMKNIKHYLLDVVHPKKVFTAIDFKKHAEKAIQEILGKGKTPIVCGGTGFYIHALLTNFPEVKPDSVLRKKIEKKTTEELFEMLQKLDKERAKTIDSKNKRRLVRAIEIAKKLGKVPPKPKSGVDSSKFEVLYLGIKRQDKNLKSLIKNRLIRRIRQGMISEVKKLRKKGVNWKRLDDFGLEYRYVSYYLRGKLTKEEMIEKLNNEINKYSKRQITWFKKYAPKTHWVKNSKEAFELVKKF